VSVLLVEEMEVPGGKTTDLTTFIGSPCKGCQNILVIDFDLIRQDIRCAYTKKKEKINTASYYQLGKIWVRVSVMMFNATFNTISVISWTSGDH
jgi:hypothetical protein